jgi:hypothetical protein
MKIKPTSAYKMCAFITYIENLLHVLATFGEVMFKGYVTKELCISPDDGHKRWANM